jgi:hypothetical protein
VKLALSFGSFSQFSRKNPGAGCGNGKGIFGFSGHIGKFNAAFTHGVFQFLPAFRLFFELLLIRGEGLKETIESGIVNVNIYNGFASQALTP